MNRIDQWNLRRSLEEDIRQMELFLGNLKTDAASLPSCPCCPTNGLCLVDAFRGSGQQHVKRICYRAGIPEKNLLAAINYEYTLTDYEFMAISSIVCSNRT